MAKGQSIYYEDGTGTATMSVVLYTANTTDNIGLRTFILLLLHFISYCILYCTA